MSTFKVFKYCSYGFVKGSSDDRHVLNVEADNLHYAIRKVKDEIKSVRSFKVEDFLINEWVDIRFTLRVPRLGKKFIYYRIELDKKEDMKMRKFNVFKATSHGSMELFAEVNSVTVHNAVTAFKKVNNLSSSRLVGQNETGQLYNIDGNLYLFSPDTVKANDIPINSKREEVKPMKYVSLQEAVLTLTVGQKIRSNSGDELVLLNDGKLKTVDKGRWGISYSAINLSKELFSKSWYVSSISCSMQEAMDKISSGMSIYIFNKDRMLDATEEINGLTLAQLVEAKWFYEPSEKVL